MNSKADSADIGNGSATGGVEIHDYRLEDLQRFQKDDLWKVPLLLITISLYVGLLVFLIVYFKK